MEWLEKLLEVNSVIAAVFGAGILLTTKKLVKGLLDYLKNKQNIKIAEQAKTENRFKGLEKAMVAMLHNKLYRQCEVHLTEGFISIDDLDDLDYLFTAYKNLNGNGTGETLYNKVKVLPHKKMKVGI